MQNLILIRGLPGSGKSTLAASFQPAYMWLETDMYFVDSLGIYQFDPDKLTDAHEWCQFRTRHALQRGNNVVVSNTFSQHWEMTAYHNLARCFNASVHVITCTGNYGSVHNVPIEAVERMRNRWET